MENRYKDKDSNRGTDSRIIYVRGNSNYMKEIRSCIICRKKKNKHELIRVISQDGNAVWDKKCNAPSRGIYICNEISCLEKIMKAKYLEKIIKIDVTEEKLKKLVDEILGEKQVGKN